jgi:hypothetical protein
MFNTAIVKKLIARKSALACGFAGLLIVTQSSAWAEKAPESLDNGYRQMYNMDFAAAHKTFEAWQAVHPDDPIGAASNAAAYLFSEFERLRILDIDLFTESRRLEDLGKLKPDPKIKVAFEDELAKATQIATKILAESPEDGNALFARLLTDGLRGDYAVLIEKRKTTGLELLKSSRAFAEKLIAIDPSYHDAYLAVGIENYLLGLRSAPMRWMLRLSGAETDKEKGIENLRITAEKGRYLAPYARLLLAIVALRDQDRTAAVKLLTDLAREFPQNRLYRIELARWNSSERK